MRSLSILLMVIAAGCGSESPDLASLQRELPADLRMPGATELGHFFGDKRATVEGPQPAFDTRVFGIQVDQTEVHAFYDRELQRAGWRPDRLSGTLGSVELESWGWCKGSIKFRIGIQDQDRAFRPEFYRGETFRTVFDASMTGRDPALGCPTQIRR